MTNYRNTDKSTMQSILDAAYVGPKMDLASYGLLTQQCLVMMPIINNNLQKSIDNAENTRNNILIVCSISLIKVSLLIWYQILSKLRKVHKNLKKLWYWKNPWEQRQKVIQDLLKSCFVFQILRCLIFENLQFLKENFVL